KNKVYNYEGDNINLDNRKPLIKEQWEIIQRLNGDILKDILKVVGKEEIQQAELSRRLGFSKLFRDKNLKEENNWVVYSFAELGKTQGIIKTGNKGRNKYISSGENLEYKPIDFELLFDTGKRSKAESRIANILHSNKITFQSQKKFRDLKGNKRLLSYDFYLPDYEILIECQGRQHSEPVEFFGGKAQFELQRDYDQRKRQYAKDNDYLLLEIDRKSTRLNSSH